VTEYDPDRHHRRSIRLKGYDYTQPGAYFVTMVVLNRDALFGQITNGKMNLNPTGQIIRVTWLKLPATFAVRLDEWVIMPNHFHGIIWILVGAGVRVKQWPDPLSTGEAYGNKVFGVSEILLPYASPQPPKGTQPGSLNAVVQNFKSVSTRKINQALQTPGSKIWQRDYYERIIRNERELIATRQYIRDNPLRWEQDSENPARGV